MSTSTFADQACDHILTVLLRRDLQPGDVVDRRQIAGDLGFSLIPVSDAVQRLTHEGFLMTRRRQGTFVRPPNIEPSNAQHHADAPDGWSEYRNYVGSFWGEVNSNTHRALGCVGTITDGALRDLDEMTGVGFKALARRLCVGHAFSHPVSWNCPVDLFGRSVQPGDLIHADKHGFLVIPPEDHPELLEAARFMDNCECSTLIPAARESAGKSQAEILSSIDGAAREFGRLVRERFGSDAETSETRSTT